MMIVAYGTATTIVRIGAIVPWSFRVSVHLRPGVLAWETLPNIKSV